MSYTTSDITVIASVPFDLGRIVRATTAHRDKVIQCYVSGRLAAWQHPRHGTVEFVLADPVGEDVFFLLAVDQAEANTDYWSEAFPAAAGVGSRIVVETPQEISRREPGHVWNVRVGDSGEQTASALVHRQEFYPGGRFSGGWGKNFGFGGWGWNGFDCAGWGGNWGRGEWGFDCHMLTWTSDPLPSGTYPVRVTVEDAHGNESIAYETTVTVTAYPRPASGLTVESYDKDTDTLTLSFTASEDLIP